MNGGRSAALDDIASSPLDVLIAGGGINGAGIARDLALRAQLSGKPLRIAVVDRAHFGSGTSGRNSQLIHGGLRYLKNLELHLVKEALAERAILLRIAPQLVEPLGFLIPMRDAWSAVFYGAGLYVYDLLAGHHRIARHSHLTASALRRLEPRMRPFFSGARFFDCRVNSARLVLLNVRDAVQNGAMAANYVSLESAEKGADGRWLVELLDTLSGRRFSAATRAMVNATGAWSREDNLRLVRGSHLILPRLGNSDNAISYFGRDGRIVFFIPWGTGHAFTLIGTTEVDHHGSPDDVRISPEEVTYLRSVAEEVFPGAGALDPISTYSSLRPLVRDESASANKTSREHRIYADDRGIVHVTGGKYTTYRLMSEEASDLLAHAHFPELAGVHATATTPLPDVEEPSVELAVRHEFAQRLTDLMFVSTYWGYERRWTAEAVTPTAVEMGRLLGWSETRVAEEIELFLRATALPTP